MGKARLKVAIIGCEPKNSLTFELAGKRYEIRHLMRRRIEVLGEKYKTKVHWPVKDIRDFPSTKNIDAVIIPGSPLNADDETLEQMEWMRKLFDFIAHTHEKVPMIGVCFGHQAIAKVFGSNVRAYPKRRIFYEVGFEMTKLTEEGMDDPLFNDMPNRFLASYSHFQYVADVPEGGEKLAKSINHKNKSIQAYRVGETTYGVQFHPDYDGDNLTEIVRARTAIMKENNIWGRPLILDVGERQDHKVLYNFLQLI